MDDYIQPAYIMVNVIQKYKRGPWVNAEYMRNVKCSIFVSCKLIEAEWRIYESVNYTIIDSDNGLSTIRRQAIILTNADILPITPYGTYFSEISFKSQMVSFKKMLLKLSLASVC